MREFKRISVDPKVKNGLPCIRDTGITVSQVVKRVAHEKPTIEVLADYPNLESEDIEEALAYAVAEMPVAISTSLFDIRVPMTNIQGYSTLILELTKSGGITDEQRIDFVNGISTSSVRLNQMLFNLLNWSRWVYGNPYSIPWSGIAISEALDLAGVSKNPNVQIKMAENLPLVRENGTLVIAFSGLVQDDFFRRFKKEALIIVTRQAETKILVHIERQFAHETNDPMNSLEPILIPTSPITTAAIIIQEHGGELQTHLSDNGVIFEFNLPIWQENIETPI